MKPCFITQKDEILGDMNTFRIWRRWGSLRAFGDSTFEIRGGWFDKEDPVRQSYWCLDGQQESGMSVPSWYEHMIRIEIAEPEDLVITLLLNELDGV